MIGEGMEQQVWGRACHGHAYCGTVPSITYVSSVLLNHNTPPYCLTLEWNAFDAGAVQYERQVF